MLLKCVLGLCVLCMISTTHKELDVGSILHLDFSKFVRISDGASASIMVMNEGMVKHFKIRDLYSYVCGKMLLTR